MSEEETGQVEIPATNEKKFNLGKHVRIINPIHPLFGKTGKVICIAHHLDDKVWIDMDETPPHKMIKFMGRDDFRHNWVIFDAEDCEEVLP